jgi:hypothetical protein
MYTTNPPNEVMNGATTNVMQTHVIQTQTRNGRRQRRTRGWRGILNSIARILALAALALTPLSGWCQSALVPEFFPGTDSIPSDLAYVAQAYFFGTPSGNAITDIVVAGNVITAKFDPACSTTCPASTYAQHYLDLPALAQGSYNLNIVAASNPSLVLAQFPLVVGSQSQQQPSTPQMFTIPAQPAGNQPFSLHAFFTPYTYGWTPQGVSVSGTVITAKVGQVPCGFGPCPPGIGIFYGPVLFDFPPLSAGSYTVRVVDASATTVVYAQYPLVVVAGTPAGIAATPALQPFMLWCLMALLALPALRTLRKAPRSTKNSGNTHG